MSESKQEEILSKQETYLFPAVITYYSEPLVVDKAKGMTVTDVEGREYLDFFGGILTVSVGHCNERVNEALHDQNEKLQHISTLYPTKPQVDLAETLARITPGRLQKSFFTNSGTEADETAIMLARCATGTQEFVALRHSYSGRSMLAVTTTAHSNWRVFGDQVMGVKHIVSPYCYRCPFHLTYPSCDVACAQDMKELIETTTTGRVAAFMAEPIQGVGGFITPPKEYFKIATEIVRNHGGLFIADEVQTGFGRTGGKMFGIEHYDVEPDIMTMAKGVANGIPMGVTIATPEVANAWVGLTISTFGGNPVSSRAAKATIDVIEEDDLAQNAETVGDYLRDRLLEMQENFPVIGDVRGMGLMQALELVEDRETKEPAKEATLRLFEETRKRGLLIGKGGLYGNVIRIAPALNVTKAEVDEFVRIMNESFAAMSE